jgi:hypothetical protein
LAGAIGIHGETVPRARRVGYGQRFESALRLKGNMSTQRRFPGSPRCRHRGIHSRAAPIQVGSTINESCGLRELH